MKLRYWIPVLCAMPWVALFASPQTQIATEKIDFARDVLPTLRANCFQCHSGKQAQGGLLLDGRDSILKGGNTGKVLEPGKANSSLILDRILGKGGKPRMPMGFAPVPDEQIKKIAGWIDQGAEMPKAFTNHPHWAYLPPKEAALPSTRLKNWERNGIDCFVLARLEKAGLKPSPEAEKSALLRRVSLDLIGLPPTPQELDNFIADKSPNAYNKVIERLMASPHYGERQARVWLDLSRYADTDGYEKDLRRVAWPFRDWVINAYNQNMPFDEFTVEQLAGDLMPKPTTAQLVATGFHRNTMHNLEGGVDQDEARYQVMVDRVNTTASVWLGSTMACSRCHDHKYDPFTQRDYFRMYAFFGNTDHGAYGNPNIGEQKYFEPTLPVPTPEQATQQAAIDAQMEASAKKAEAGFINWQKTRKPIQWTAGEPTHATATDGLILALQPDGSYLATGPNPAKSDYTVSLQLPAGNYRGLRLEVMADPSLPASGPGRSSGGNFVLSEIYVLQGSKRVDVRAGLASFQQSNQPIQGTVRRSANDGWAVAPQFGEDHRAIFALNEPIKLVQPSEITVVLRCQSVYEQHNIGRFRLALTTEANPLPDALAADAPEAKLKEAYLLTDPATVRKSELQEQLNKLNSEIGTAQILRERPISGTPSAWVRHRGEFLGKTVLVTADVPSFLGRLDSKGPINRLSLAKWIVNPKNPLTARVQMNRMWEQYFGRGIVETTEDLGTQSAKPSNPELLDWLAVQFVKSRWDTKAMHRLIVTSATYRQSSRTTPELARKDPQNILLSRGPRFRMEAEMIRDSALSIAGLLNPKMGGPSVYPSQPSGTWDSPYSGEMWADSHGGDEYRRSIYTFWKRTAPYPKFMAFDATSREECTIRRTRTNTPLQALAMLNDEGTMQASRALAARVKSEAKGNPLAYAFRLCTARMPNPQEQARLQRLYSELGKHYRLNPKDATKVAKDPDQAAMTMVANALLNLDETLNKG